MQKPKQIAGANDGHGHSTIKQSHPFPEHPAFAAITVEAREECLSCFVVTVVLFRCHSQQRLKINRVQVKSMRAKSHQMQMHQNRHPITWVILF
jgi:hypothetical protein